MLPAKKSHFSLEEFICGILFSFSSFSLSFFSISILFSFSSFSTFFTLILSLSFNSSFLAEIEKCIEEPERLGILFKRYERRLGMYIIYCQNKPKSEFIVSEHDAYFEVRIFFLHFLSVIFSCTFSPIFSLLFFCTISLIFLIFFLIDTPKKTHSKNL